MQFQQASYIIFVGNTIDGTSSYWFGYIFGEGSYSDNSSYVPSSLIKINVNVKLMIILYIFIAIVSINYALKIYKEGAYNEKDNI